MGSREHFEAFRNLSDYKFPVLTISILKCVALYEGNPLEDSFTYSKRTHKKQNWTIFSSQNKSLFNFYMGNTLGDKLMSKIFIDCDYCWEFSVFVIFLCLLRSRRDQKCTIKRNISWYICIPETLFNVRKWKKKQRQKNNQVQASPMLG